MIRLVVEIIAAVLVLGGAGLTGYFTLKAAKRSGEATEAAAQVQAEVNLEGQFMQGLLTRIKQAEDETTSCRQENSELRTQVRTLTDQLGDLARDRREDHATIAQQGHVIRRLRAYLGNLQAYIEGLDVPLPESPFGLFIEEQAMDDPAAAAGQSPGPLDSTD